MSLLASASKNVPATPRFSFMASPTMETMAQSDFTSMGFMSFSLISRANSFLRTSCTEFAAAFRTQNESVYSEDDWVIKRTEMPALLTAAKTRAAIPFLPFMPDPLTEIMAQSFRQEIPRTSPDLLSLSKGP